MSMRRWFFRLSGEENLLAFMKTFPKYKYCSGSQYGTHTGFTICHWSILSLVHPLLDAEKIRVNVHVLYGFQSDNLKNHRRVPESVFRVKIADSEPVKRVTGRIF
jgi:hypothetical protein